MKTKLLKMKQLANTCLIVLLAMVLNACQKNELPVTTDSFNERGMAAQISVWLDKQIAATVGKGRKANLENLKNSLQTRSLWVEDLRLGKKLIIVPISESMEIKANKDKPVTSYFVARMDVNGNIYAGEIMQYAIPYSTGKIAMPVNTLHDFYNFSSPEGIFTCIQLRAMNIKSSEMEYNKDGALVRITKTDSRNPEKNTANYNSQAREIQQLCVDYYEATDWYDQITGELTSTTYTFLYTDCTGGSAGGYDPSDPNSPNPGSGGTIILVPSGGSPINPSIEPPQEEREPAIDDISWQVSKSPKSVPFWEVRSNEKFTGFKVPANKWHNRIGTITHNSSMILNGSSTTAVWTEIVATPWISRDSVIAKMTISGTVVYPPSAPYPYFIINKRPFIFAASELFQ